MEILIIFIIVAIFEKLFKTKVDQKNIQEARKKRMANQPPSETQGYPQREIKRDAQKSIRPEERRPKSLADKIKDEIEKGYGDLERHIKPSESRKIEKEPIKEPVKEPIIERTKDLKKKRYLTEYDSPYETYNGKGSLEGREYKGRYASEYEKPYETYGRKTGTLEGKTYKKMDEDFYKRREKVIPILDKKSGISMQQQVLSGFIYLEILGKPKSLQKR